jgi:putative membrane protein
MGLRTYRTFQALILALLGLFLITRIWDGGILYYINQRFVIVTAAAAFDLVILAQLILRSRQSYNILESDDSSGHYFRNQNIWWLVLCLVVGMLAPIRPLGSSAVDNRGINLSVPLAVSSSESGSVLLEIPAIERSFLDWMRIFNSEADPRDFVGETADITGFVYHDSRLGETQFMVGRFSITCCVADATALGMVVQWENADKLLDNQWVHVRGVVLADKMPEDSYYAGRTMPLLIAEQVILISEPVQPYLYP